MKSKKSQLKINGWKKITRGIFMWKERFTTFDNVVLYRYCYSLEGKLYYVIGNDLQTIGYTDNLTYTDFLLSKIRLLSYNTFWVLCGRK